VYQEKFSQIFQPVQPASWC